MLKGTSLSYRKVWLRNCRLDDEENPVTCFYFRTDSKKVHSFTGCADVPFSGS
jgi:hypothetical protein